MSRFHIHRYRLQFTYSLGRVGFALSDKTGRAYERVAKCRCGRARIERWTEWDA